MNKSDIQEIILQQIEAYNEIADEKIDYSAGAESVLFGQGSALDSTGFVSLMLDIEQAISDETGENISLVDARAMSRAHSPFRTISRLSEYILALLEGQDNG